MVFICDLPYSNNLEAFTQFPFPLSDFQKYAIEGIIKGNHVLVTAHTGSGKTLPAEFAIKHFTSLGKKVIYTSPIKALSNQKFYDFTHKYPDISFGLLTGDIKTNPTADVLIMTTEILMNALFSNNKNKSELSFQMDIDNDIGCVIFDEVHYINDFDRGQTWEQTILMLPLHIQMVMLSATIDNPIGFAEWIENRGCNNEEYSKSVYLASTEHRIVPLTHYGYFATTETPFKTTKDKALQQTIRDSTNRLVTLKTSSGKFIDTGYNTISYMNTIFNKYDWRMKRKFVLNNLAAHLKERDMLPAIFFVFSRKGVEQCANEITTNLLEDDSKVPYIVRNECEQIIRRFPNYKEYLELPEYNDLVKLLEKGIGIHHSGMIPVLREIIELMISKRYIKILFATESFAIGLDCPIKTAVFSGLKKFDGSKSRFLLSHEYTQMAGRAGRRGIDTIGHIIHCNNLFELPNIQEYKDILCGKPQKLVSKFKISYPLILNLIKHKQSTSEQENIADYTSFVNKSMLSKELDIAIYTQNNEVNEKINLYDRQNELLININTPISVCDEFITIEEMRSMYSSKKQKEINKKIQSWKEEYHFFITDVEKVKSYNLIKKSLNQNRQQLDYLRNYTDIQISYLCEILEKYDFVIENKFTEYGIIASHIHEIHPLIGSVLINKTSFMTYSSTHIASIISIFTDISISDDKRILKPPLHFIDNINILQKYESIFANEELERGLFSPIVKFTFDITDIVEEWCSFTTESECKYLIQTKLKERGISLGDFTKAILKIVVIVKEFQLIAESMGNLSFLTELKNVEPLLLKYVATNQSLYV